MIIRVFLLIAMCLSSVACASASDSGPYCGIYAVYGAARAIGVEADFEPLVDEQFVSARKGSTISDLEKAASKLGVRATTYGGMGLASLKETVDPLILHMASFGQLGAYNHWTLFLGMQDGRARIIDEKGAVHLMNIAELLARWDGVALAISRRDSPLTNFGSVEMSSLFSWAVIVVLSLAGMAWFVRKLSHSHDVGRRWRVAVVFAVTTVLVLVRESNPHLGFLQNRSCVDFIMAAEGHKDFQILSTEDLIALMETCPDLAIFDNRYDGDMDYGHVPGARPMPVNSSQQEVAEQVAGLDLGKPIVVYCQSSGCRFSNRMAIVLTGFGFTDIRIYRDGWMGWKEYQDRISFRAK